MKKKSLKQIQKESEGDFYFFTETVFRVESPADYCMPAPYTRLAAYKMVHELPELCIACGQCPVYDAVPVRICNKRHDVIFLVPICRGCASVSATQALKIPETALEQYQYLLRRVYEQISVEHKQERRRKLAGNDSPLVSVSKTYKSRRLYKLPDDRPLLDGYKLLRPLPAYCPACCENCITTAGIVHEAYEVGPDFILPLCRHCAERNLYDPLEHKLKVPASLLVPFEDAVAAIELGWNF